MSAGTLALWIATAFALGAALAAVLTRPGDNRPVLAARCLAMAALFTAVSAGMLLVALHRADLSIDFVARHVTLALPPGMRWRAVFADPSGASLAAAAVLGATAAWWVRGGTRTHVTAVAAVTMLVLLAAPLAGHPLRQLPWQPIDGMGLSPLLRAPLSTIYGFAMASMVASAAISLGAALESGDAVHARTAEIAGLVALTCSAWQSVLYTHVAVAAGMSMAPSPARAGGGIWLAAITVAAVAWIVLRSTAAPRQARIGAAMALLLVAVGLVLAAGGTEAPSIQVQAMGALAFGIAVVAAWQTWRAAPTRALSLATGLRDRSSQLATAGLSAGVLAAVLAALSTPRELRLTSGGAATAAFGGRMSHQGLSRYDETDATVLALAMEYRGWGRETLGSAEQREYVDARGSIVGSLVRQPAIFVRPPGAVVVWLTGTGTADEAELRTLALPGHWLWWVMMAALSGASLLVVSGLGAPATNTKP